MPLCYGVIPNSLKFSRLKVFVYFADERMAAKFSTAKFQVDKACLEGRPQNFTIGSPMCTASLELKLGLGSNFNSIVCVCVCVYW